ncbi:MAG: putative porin [Luteolibacter sp.]
MSVRSIPLRLAPLLALALHPAFAEDEPLAVPSLDQLPAEGVTPVGDETTETPVGGDAKPTDNVTINLIHRLVEKGILSKDEADTMIRQAEADATRVRAQQRAEVQAAVQQEALAPVQEGEVGVTYIPETVKEQMREEIKHELLTEARIQNWSAPAATPEWVRRYKVFGDVRIRSEGSFFPSGNDNTGAFPNFNAINTGAPFDTTGTQFSPQYNVDQDRTRFRLRARVGAEIDLDDGFTAGLRLATGENNSPTSPNQSLGGANNGQGGNFSKYAIWIDRAFLSYHFGEQGCYDVDLYAGRFDNPFFNTDIVWDDDLGFDGFAAKGKFRFNDDIKVFATAGAFPVFNTDFNFSSNRPDKFESTDKYIYGGQIGVEWKIAEKLTGKFGVAFYDFDGVKGKLSTPYVPLTSSDAGDTDGLRPSFAQKGNTYMPLRNILQDPSNNNGNSNQWQYFGLASPFRELTVTGRLDYDGYEPVRLSLTGEFVKNVAFDKASVAQFAVNNKGAGDIFEGGDTAWMVNFVVGDAALEKFGDWQTYLGYRYVESDSVVDGLTDSDFGGGGTNLKGYTLGANFALSKAVRIGARWMSADQIAGPTYRNDILQFDLNAKF